MRTTITIDDHLLEALKKRASSAGSSVSRLIEDAVRLLLDRSPSTGKSSDSFELVTFGAGGRFSRYNVDKTAELLAADDEERYGEPGS